MTSRRLRRRGGNPTAGVALACSGAVALAGVVAGGVAAGEARSACAVALGSGDIVVAAGTLNSRLAAGGRSRLTLSSVTLRVPGREGECAVPRLVSWVDSVESGMAAGEVVVVRGEWRRVGRPTAWPRRAGRAGIVVGRLRSPGEEGLDVTHTTTRPRLPSRLRARASDRLRRIVAPDVGPVARALVLAEKDELSGALRTRFARAGMAHFLAISGLHVGIVGSALAVLLAGLVGRGRAASGAAILVWLYVLGIGAPPSAVRASVLLTGWAGAAARGRPARRADLLGLAALITLAWDPLLLTEPGFQLSYAGFGGLGVGALLAGDAARRVAGSGHVVSGSRALRGAVRRGSSLAIAAGAGIGAFLATAPVSAAHFQQVAPASLVSHFVGATLTAGAICALAAGLAAPEPLGRLAGDAATVVLRWMVRLAGELGELPAGHLQVTPPTSTGWLAIAVASIGVWAVLSRGQLRRALVPWGCALGLVVGGPAMRAHWLPRHSLLCSLDVGQGDAAVLRTSGGHWMLFDAGPRTRWRDAGRDVVVPWLRELGAGRVEVFVLSHPDMDHLGGFDSVLDALPVTHAVDTGDPVPSRGYAAFLGRAMEEGVEWLRAETGDRLTLDEVTVTVLGPVRRMRAGQVGNGRGGAPATSSANATSLAARVNVSGFAYVNTGDATSADELALTLAWPADSLRADVLKIGHHGSRTSTDPAWLEATRPALAVISAGRGNTYGHPHATVLRRLRDASVPRVWRTDRDGSLCVEIDGRGRWKVRGEDEWHDPFRMARALTTRKAGE